MKKGFFLWSVSLVFLFYCTPICAQSEATTKDGYELKIKITNIKKPTGMIRLAAYSPDQEFLGEETATALNSPVNQKGEVIVAINNLPLGTYAISVYHDEDGNGDLDSNFMGIPKEPYGFSNNARGLFGPPKYKSARFDFKEDSQMIEIKVK